MKWLLQLEEGLHTFKIFMLQTLCIIIRVIQCSIQGQNLPQKYQTGSNSKRQKGGRPKNLEKNEAFSRLCSYLVDTDDEQITISNLGEKCRSF